MLRAVALVCITYAAIAVLAFGSLLKPIAFATFWSDKLGAPYWGCIVLACFAVGGAAFLIPARFSVIRGPVFVTVGLLGSLVAIGAYADNLRSKALNDFGADRLIQHSFLESIRKAPEEHQSFLHAAAMKDCVPYAWSYSTMRLYRVPLGAAVNVMPRKWLAECSIDHRLLYDAR